jgi:hypothetical protein
MCGMFMMNKKRKKTIATVVAVVLSFGLLLSAVAGYFSTTGYNYNYSSLPQTPTSSQK